MSKSCMISQPRYMPSMTYLMRIAMVDVYVCYDNVQRVPRFVENRQRMVNPSGGTTWATVSICSSSREIIKDSVICNLKEMDKHKETVRHFYINYPHYDQSIVDGYFKAVSLSTNMRDSFLNGIEYLMDVLGIDTKVWVSSLLRYDKSYGAIDLMNICNAIGADVYVTGVNGSKYGLSNELSSNYQVEVYEDVSVIEPQVCFFHQLFLHGIEHWKTVAQNAQIVHLKKEDDR